MPGIASFSQPRFWPKDTSTLVGSVRIRLAPSASASDVGGPHSTVRTVYTAMDKVVERVDKLLRERIPGLEELVVQVDSEPLHMNGE